MPEDSRTAIEPGLHVLRRNRHSDAVTEALPERPGGSLDAGRVMVLGMAGGQAAKLPKAFDFIEREIVAGQIQQAVQQHRAVTCREHESVAAVPLRIARIVAQEARP